MNSLLSEEIILKCEKKYLLSKFKVIYMKKSWVVGSIQVHGYYILKVFEKFYFKTTNSKSGLSKFNVRTKFEKKSFVL